MTVPSDLERMTAKAQAGWSLRLELERYVRELRASNEVCAQPRQDVLGQDMPCLQCYERANVIRRLEEILSK